jgi:ATP-dependent RNA helicase RhlB
MKRDAVLVAKHLKYNGLKCLHLNGDLSQNRRQKTLEQFKNGQVQLLVATDVAARGLHIENLDMVINYDLPGNSENYIHRIGRTARAGKTGKAITLACEKYIYNLEGIESMLNEKIPVGIASDDMYAVSKSEGRIFKNDGRLGNRNGRKMSVSSRRKEYRKKGRKFSPSSKSGTVIRSDNTRLSKPFGYGKSGRKIHRVNLKPEPLS